MFLRAAALSCPFLTLSFADILYLRTGSQVQGSYAGGDTRQIKILVRDHIETYPIEDVARLEFGGSAAPSTPAPAPSADAATPPPPAATPVPQYQEQGLRVDRPAPPPPVDTPQASGGEIPSGTNLIVRMVDSVDSERDSVGKTFRASIDEPVMVGGQTVIPRGSEVVVKLINDTESGKFTGRTSLTLNLQSVQINGRMIDISTSDVTQASGSRTARTAKTVGGGAVAGAILGGLIGGGKGAAIGAASGGTIGAGAEVLTKGQRVKIPSEARLSFLLQQPLTY